MVSDLLADGSDCGAEVFLRDTRGHVARVSFIGCSPERGSVASGAVERFAECGAGFDGVGGGF